MRVTEIWRFPVKSMGGETLLSADVTDLGIAGDRGWSVYDCETGTTLTARRTPELLFAGARIAEDELVITLPDGSEAGEGDDGAISSWLPRRFRTNVIVDGSGEDEFVGGRISIGDALLDVTKQVDRCVMVSRPQPGIDRDLEVLKTINAERGTCLAVGCLVVAPGRIALGDRVTVPG